MSQSRVSGTAEAICLCIQLKRMFILLVTKSEDISFREQA